MTLLDSYLELRIRIGQVLLVVMGLVVGGAFTVGAFDTGQWAWLVAVPMNAVGIAAVVIGGRTRHRTRNARGTALSVAGGLLILASVWAAFMLGNAFPT